MTSAQTTVRLGPERIELILNQIDQLPTLPVVASRVLQATISKDSCASDVIELIESDQSLTSRILKLVSKASLGMARDVDTVDKAVVLLGFDAIRHAVLSIKVFETFTSLESIPESHFDRNGFWKHSLAVACASHLIAERWPGHVDPEVAFVCGLLHDLGKVALDACLPKSYDRVASISSGRHACIIDVEQELLGLDHTVVGKRLSQRWNFPASVIECTWLHHHTPDMLPDCVSNPDLVQMVNLADTWVREQRLGFSGNYLNETPSKEIAAQMGMPVEYLTEIAPTLPQRIEERAELIGLSDLTSGKMFAETVANANLELGRYNEELTRTNKQLEARSRYLDLVHKFNCDLHSQLTMVDICQLGAGCARELLGLPCVAVFSRHPQGKISYIGLRDERGSMAEVVCGEIPDQEDASWGGAAPYASFISAPPSTETLRERLADRLGPAPHWMLPITKDGDLWGGILFHAPQVNIDRFTVNLDEIVMFATVLCNALINGHEKLQAERLNEGLAEVNRQLKAAQAELLRTRSLSMIAEMAAGAAHELNNPLAVVAGRSELLADAVADKKIKNDLKIITEQAHRCSSIVNDLMLFAKPDPPQRERIHLPGLLQRLVTRWTEESSLLPQQITLEISDEGVYLNADLQQIEKMFDELIKNAFEAAEPQKAHFSINCRRELTDDRIVVTIEDNGCGMSPEVLEKARAPFFSHRPAGRGRGLGLSRAIRWCEINGGKLRIESQLNVGTKVWLEFPGSL